MINQWWLVNNHFVVFSYHFWFHATRCFVCSGCWPRLRSPVESHRSPPVQVPSRMERRLDGSTPNCWGFLPKAQRPSQLPFKTPDAKKTQWAFRHKCCLRLSFDANFKSVESRWVGTLMYGMLLRRRLLGQSAAESTWRRACPCRVRRRDWC